MKISAAQYPPPWCAILPRVIQRARARAGFDLGDDADAAAVLWRDYVTAPHCAYHLIAHRTVLLEALLDTALHCGRRRTNRWLQEAINWRQPMAPVPVDGELGPDARAELHCLDAVPIATFLLTARLRFEVQQGLRDLPRGSAEPVLARVQQVRELLLKVA